MPLSTLRVLVMTVGELDFADFVQLYKNNNPYTPFPSVAYTFLFFCLVLLSVGLMNLLVRKHPVYDKDTIVYGRQKRLKKMLFINIIKKTNDGRRRMRKSELCTDCNPEVSGTNSPPCCYINCCEQPVGIQPFSSTLRYFLLDL